MAIQNASTVLEHFATRVKTITTASVAGGVLEEASYRFALAAHPDSGIHGKFYVDLEEVAELDDGRSTYGRGEKTWTGTVTVELGYFRGGGDMNEGDRKSVAKNAGDDCQRVVDVVGEPSQYDGANTGIIKIIPQPPHKRVAEGERFEIWACRFHVEWRSDVMTQ